MRQKLSPEDNRRAWLWAALIVLMMLAVGTAAVALLTRDWRQEAVRLPEAGGELLSAAEGLDSIRI
ncbi:MAG: hypothetical protein IJ343_07135 [Clostridia bacterium]|nr:hypothetical protein [Clostridia bacterium]